jgi:hypothetical protein
MILGHLTMSLGMALLLRDTTQSSTSDALLARTNSKIGHGQSMRNSAGLNTKESRSTARQLTMLCLQG